MKFPKEITRALREFGYFDPSQFDDAVSILGELGSRVTILAGETSLVAFSLSIWLPPGSEDGHL